MTSASDLIGARAPLLPAPPIPVSQDAGHSSTTDVLGARFERIIQLQRQATYPLDPVAAARAQSQLAHVEVPWLTRQLKETLTQLDNLTDRA